LIEIISCQACRDNDILSILLCVLAGNKRECSRLLMSPCLVLDHVLGQSAAVELPFSELVMVSPTGTYSRGPWDLWLVTTGCRSEKVFGKLAGGQEGLAG
jgi:hypothetical protein